MKIVTNLSKASAKSKSKNVKSKSVHVVYDGQKAMELNYIGIQLKNDGYYDDALIYFLKAKRYVKYNGTIEKNIELCQRYIVDHVKKTFQSREQQARELNRKGKSLTNLGYYDGALSYFLEAEILAPDNDAVKHNIELCRRCINNY